MNINNGKNDVIYNNAGHVMIGFLKSTMNATETAYFTGSSFTMPHKLLVPLTTTSMIGMSAPYLLNAGTYDINEDQSYYYITF